VFVLSVTGYEEYSPIWLSKNCTKEEFIADVQDAVKLATEELTKGNEFLDGHDLQEAVVSIMTSQKGFEVVQAIHEVFLGGEVYYSDHHRRPDGIPPDAWEIIIRHNAKVDEEFHKDCMKLHAEREAKQSKESPK
jgi:hypothetical protein